MISVLFVVGYLAPQISKGLKNGCRVNEWRRLGSKAVCQDAVVLKDQCSLVDSPRPHYSLQFTSFFPFLFSFPNGRGYHSFFFFKTSLSNLYIQHRAWTHNPGIKSHSCLNDWAGQAPQDRVAFVDKRAWYRWQLWCPICFREMV